MFQKGKKNNAKTYFRGFTPTNFPAETPSTSKEQEIKVTSKRTQPTYQENLKGFTPTNFPVATQFMDVEQESAVVSKYSRPTYRENLRGFTLVELLVVIAIIGILSTVVIASLGTARTKSQDTALIANLNNIRPQAVLFADNNDGNYGIVAVTCSTEPSIFVSPVIANQITAAISSGGGDASCQSTPSSWAVSVPLKSDPISSWCVDSTNISRKINGAISSSVCP